MRNVLEHLVVLVSPGAEVQASDIPFIDEDAAMDCDSMLGGFGGLFEGFIGDLSNSLRLVELTVTWPNGREQVFENLPVNHRYTITEPSEAPPPLRSPSPTGHRAPPGAG